MTGDYSNWSEWEKHVLRELERLSDNHEKILDVQNEIKIEVAMLKVRAALWGALTGGIITAAITIIGAFLSRG